MGAAILLAMLIAPFTLVAYLLGASWPLAIVVGLAAPVTIMGALLSLSVMISAYDDHKRRKFRQKRNQRLRRP